MRIALCLIIKNEGQYLEEWLDYHRKVGVDFFIIYDNQSNPPISNEDKDVTIIKWEDNNIGSQMRAYKHCSLNFNDFDFIGFIDTDEFYESISMNIKEDFESLLQHHGDISGIGLYWRNYGNPSPYFDIRKSINDYVYYYTNEHIKSFINPKKINYFPDPHKAVIDGKYVDEQGRGIIGPTGHHTSDFFWIKHTWSRSLSEFKEKINRGSGDKVRRNYTLDHFYQYNNKCVKIKKHGTLLP